MKQNSDVKHLTKIRRGRYDQKKYQEALEHIKLLEAELSALKRIQRSRRPLAITSKKPSRHSEAVAIAVMSDVHIGSVVRKAQVNNLNEYNIAICRDRVSKFFQKVVRMTMKERQDVTIEHLILFLGGDIIDGALHLDTIMSNEVAEPMRQAIIAQDIIEGGLQYLEQHGDYKRITVVCADGNHGRVSTKQHHSSRKGNALEYFMYYTLAQRYPQFNWVIEEGLLTYLPVYNSTIRFMHGDRISFGGINGFYTYLHRRIMEWDKAIKADYTILGHLHQYTPNRRYLVNGSVVGYNDFAISLSAIWEPPTQAFLLWDKNRGATVHIPLLL